MKEVTNADKASKLSNNLLDDGKHESGAAVETNSRDDAPPTRSYPPFWRDISPVEPSSKSTRFPPRRPSLPEIDFDYTMQDVNKALQSGDHAIRIAQEAFWSRRRFSNPNNAYDVVEATNPHQHKLRGTSGNEFVAF